MTVTKLGTLLIIVLIMLLLTAWERIDVLVCECGEPVDSVKICYCYSGATCGNWCEDHYFHWSRYDGVYSYFYMCVGWKLHLPGILNEK